MKTKVTVVDYGMGNLLSVRRALEHCGAEVLVTASPTDILAAERLVLPGVGAFADGMAELAGRNLVEPLLTFTRSERPLLGICLGMQMLLSVSEEFGEHHGLGLIPGRVVAIPSAGPGDIRRKIPHVGWAELIEPETGATWQNSVLADVPPGGSVYFVHSYTVMPENDAYRLADCIYDGFRISAAIRSGAIYGCQFHPEKSGPVGLGILRRFLALR